ncbi:Ecto-ADP-ribosyltransferase 4 [Mactra antiquata]
MELFTISVLFIALHVTSLPFCASDSSYNWQDNEAPSFFQQTIKSLLHEMKHRFEGIGDVIDRAIEKMDQPKYKHLNSDQKWAGVAVNIYSSPDRIQNATCLYIHRNVNQKLPQSDQSNIWNRFRDVLVKAMTLLGEKEFPHLFRGEENNNKDKLVNQPFTYRFFSTTIDPNVTTYFGADDGIFYHILNATGTDISEYSDMPEEKEILIKPNQHFKVVLISRVPEVIAAELDKINLKYPEFKRERLNPYMLVVLKMIPMQNTYQF